MNLQKYRIGFFLIAGFSLAGLVVPFGARGEDQVVDGFQEAAVGGFPETWKSVPFKKKPAREIYRIEQEAGSPFLRAVFVKAPSAIIYRRVKWDVNKYPYLKFRWRAQQLPQPTGGEKATFNDNACGVYVGFGLTSGMKYVWSSTLSEGSYWEKEPGKFYVISKEMGTGNVGNWRSVSVDVRGDYQRFFKKSSAKNPSGIAILTDGDNSGQKAACDYRDIRISDQP